jgi:hypothetical protein
MADDLRSRVLAAVRKGLAGPLDTSKTKKPVLQGYSAHSATENGVTAQAICNTTFTKKIKDVTLLHRLSAKRDSQPGKDTTEPTMAYRAVSAEPDGTGCWVEIVELPQAQRYRKVFGVLQLKSPALVPVERWRQCVEDGKRFLAKWGDQAEGLNWSSADLFGLVKVPEDPSPSFNRLSRYDRLGLCWALKGRDVIALTAEGATIRTATGSTLTFYRHGRPAYGPLGDSLDDIDPRWRQ